MQFHTFIVSTIFPDPAQSGILVLAHVAAVTTLTTAVAGAWWHGQVGLEEHVAGQGEPGLNDPLLAPRHGHGV